MRLTVLKSRSRKGFIIFNPTGFCCFLYINIYLFKQLLLMVQIFKLLIHKKSFFCRVHNVLEVADNSLYH